MSKTAKIWLIAAAILVATGGLLFTGAMTMLKWDFSALSTIKYTTTVHQIDQKVTDITIDVDTAHVTLVASDDDTITVTCNEQTNIPYIVTVEDGKLTIRKTDERRWYQYIGIGFGSPKVTVALPKGSYGALDIHGDTGKISVAREFSFRSVDITNSTGDVHYTASVVETANIRVSTGDVTVADITAGGLDLTATTGKIQVSSVVCNGDIRLQVNTGDIHLSDTTCRNLTSDGTTGKIDLNDVIAAEKMTITRDTGDVIFDGCDAAQLAIVTDTGDVAGTLLSSKIFFTDTDTGRVEVPRSTEGGICDVRTDTGDITLSIDD